MNKSWLIGMGLSLVILATGAPGNRAEDKAAPEKAAAAAKGAAVEKQDADENLVLTGPIVIKMEEVPAFGQQGVEPAVPIRYPAGQLARCTGVPSKEVKAYPKLQSKRPLYGSVVFGGSPYDRTVGTTYHFVLDESGAEEKPSEKKTPAKEQPDKKTALADKRLVLTRRPIAVGKYDRLYFDVNGDLDLTNDPVVTLAEEPPIEALPQPSNLRVFKDLAVSFDYGPLLGQRPFAVVPQLRVLSGTMGYVYLAPKTARTGKARIGDRDYAVSLSQSRMISGRFDRPFVEVRFLPIDRPAKMPRWLAPGYLGEVRLGHDQLVTISATPLGDELTIQPYRGELGVLEVGPGGRALTELGAVGALVSRTSLIRLGEPTPRPTQELPRRYMLPVGDYLPVSLTVQYGRLRVGTRAIRDLDLGPGERTAKAPIYGIQIRKDKPFVLDFSGKPAVSFLDPRGGQSFKPGQTVAIRALLTEPWQRIVITGLWDTTQKKGEMKYRIGEKELTIPQYVSLDPTIVIRDSKGEKVSEGKMPFG